LPVVQLVYFNIMPIHCFLQEKFPQYISAARGQGGFCAIDLPDTTARDSFVNQLRSSGKNYVKNHGLSWKGEVQLLHFPMWGRPICIGYFEATRGYVIYSPRRAAPR
jgi:hypothetical protein